jgi:hypothetical protein
MRRPGTRSSNPGKNGSSPDGAAHLPEHRLEVVPHLFLGGGIAEQERGVERGHHRNLALEELPAAAKARDALARPEEALHRRRPERDDHLRLESHELLLQVRHAREHLLGLRLAVVRRPALHDVADVDLVAVETHRADHLVEQLARLADERKALLVLVGAGPLSHEAESRRAGSPSEHRLDALGVEGAAGAALHRFRQHLQPATLLLRLEKSGHRGAHRRGRDDRRRHDGAWRAR